MTKVYFVRHATPDYSIHEDALRPLTKEGMEDTKKVTELLSDKNITKAFSSPYKRAFDTIKHFAESAKLNIHIVEDFRERKVDDVWIEDFTQFVKDQWSDFNFKLSEGECLKEVQDRNVKALMQVICENEGHNIVVGSHGTAIGTIMNHFNKEFGHADFERIRPVMPFIVCFTFEGQELVNIEEFLL